MCFGLSGRPSTIHKAMNNTFRPLLVKGVLVYLDDILVVVATFKEHLKLLREVFTLLRIAGLTVTFEIYKS